LQPVLQAQHEFDDRLATLLDDMADRMEGKESEARESLSESLQRLEQTTSTYCADLPRESFAAQLPTFLPLSRRIESLASALDREI
jgi:hypothetical protein